MERLSYLTKPELRRLASMEENQSEPYWGYHQELENRELQEIEDRAKESARDRGWLTGDINQTDAWFRR